MFQKLCLIMVIAATIMGCDSRGLDGRFVKDDLGNVYEVEWKVGQVYALRNINIKKIQKLTEKKKED